RPCTPLRGGRARGGRGDGNVGCSERRGGRSGAARARSVRHAVHHGGRFKVYPFIHELSRLVMCRKGSGRATCVGIAEEVVDCEWYQCRGISKIIQETVIEQQQKSNRSENCARDMKCCFRFRCRDKLSPSCTWRFF